MNDEPQDRIVYDAVANMFRIAVFDMLEQSRNINHVEQMPVEDLVGAFVAGVFTAVIQITSRQWKDGDGWMDYLGEALEGCLEVVEQNEEEAEQNKDEAQDESDDNDNDDAPDSSNTRTH